MINEISPDSFNTSHQYLKKIHENDYILFYNNNNIVLKISKIHENYSIPKFSDIHLKNKSDIYFLGNSENKNYFIANFENIDLNSKEFVEKDLRFVMQNFHRLQAWIISLGNQFFNWYSNNKFCGKCGEKLEEKSDERALICPKCNNIIFPKVSPAIIVAIIKDDKILLAKGKHYKGTFKSILAGYTEPGESFEETVVREVQEEVGLTLDISKISYYKSQPWPISSSMMVGFFVEYSGEEKITIDENELEDAGWYSRDEMPEYPTEISIAGEMINLFINKNIPSL